MTNLIDTSQTNHGGALRTPVRQTFPGPWRLVPWNCSRCMLVIGALFIGPAMAVPHRDGVAFAGDVDVPAVQSREVAARIQSEVAAALDGQVFTGSAEKRLSQDLLLIQPSAGITATATGTFTRPAQNLQVDINSLTFSNNDSVRIALCIRAPFAGKVSAKSRIGSAGTDYAAKLTVHMNIETAIRFNRDGTITLTPHLKAVRPVVSEVQLAGQIADRLFAGTVTDAINRWMQDNPQTFHDAVLQGAEAATRMVNDERQRRMDELLTELGRHDVSPPQIEVIRQLLNSLSPHQQSLLFSAIRQGQVTDEITPQQRALIGSLSAEQKQLLLELGRLAVDRLPASAKPGLGMSASKMAAAAGRDRQPGVQQSVSGLSVPIPTVTMGAGRGVTLNDDSPGTPRNRKSSAAVAEETRPGAGQGTGKAVSTAVGSSSPGSKAVTPLGPEPMEFTPDQRRAADALLRVLRKL